MGEEHLEELPALPVSKKLCGELIEQLSGWGAELPQIITTIASDAALALYLMSHVNRQTGEVAIESLKQAIELLGREGLSAFLEKMHQEAIDHDGELGQAIDDIRLRSYQTAVISQDLAINLAGEAGDRSFTASLFYFVGELIAVVVEQNKYLYLHKMYARKSDLRSELLQRSGFDAAAEEQKLLASIHVPSNLRPGGKGGESKPDEQTQLMHAICMAALELLESHRTEKLGIWLQEGGVPQDTLMQRLIPSRKKQQQVLETIYEHLGGGSLSKNGSSQNREMEVESVTPPPRKKKATPATSSKARKTGRPKRHSEKDVSELEREQLTEVNNTLPETSPTSAEDKEEMNAAVEETIPESVKKSVEDADTSELDSLIEAIDSAVAHGDQLQTLEEADSEEPEKESTPANTEQVEASESPSILTEKGTNLEYDLDADTPIIIATPDGSLRVCSIDPPPMPEIPERRVSEILNVIRSIAQEAKNSETLLLTLMESLVDAVFQRAALVAISDEERIAIAIVARGEGGTGPESLHFESELSPLARRSTTIQSFAVDPKNCSPFGSKAYALAPLDVMHDRPVVLYADCGQDVILSLDARTIFRFAIEKLNEHLPELPGGVPDDARV